MIIYVITNKINGKQYVGQTKKTIEERFKRHCWTCTTSNPRMPISYAIKKYGKENFKIEQLAECETLEELNRLEVHYAITLNTFSPNGYNLKAGNGPTIMSEETKNKIRKANLGRKMTDEAKKRMSEAHKGVKLSESHRAGLKKASQLKIENNIGVKTYKVINPLKEEISITNLTKFCKDNNLDYACMIKTIKGRQTEHKGWAASTNDFNKEKSSTILSEEHKEKIRKSRRGKKRSEESRKKQSEYYKNKYKNEEDKIKLLEILAKHYSVINPQGENIIVKNIKKFCSDNNLKYWMVMKNLKKGKGLTDGWYFKYMIRVNPNYGKYKYLSLDSKHQLVYENTVFLTARDLFKSLINKDMNDSELYLKMKITISKKLDTYANLLKLLLDTDNKEISYEEEDSLWGCGSSGHGQNWLGKILMEVREEFKKRLELLA